MNKKILGLAVDAMFPEHLRKEREEWLTTLFPDIDVVVRTIPYGPAFMESDFDQALAGKVILEEVIKAEEEGFAAIALLCLSDPFLDACRESVRIPVIGAGQASFLFAAAISTRAAIVTINEGGFNVFSKLVRNSGVAEYAIPVIRAINMTIEEMNNDPNEVIKRLVEQTQMAIKEDRAQAIILGCTEMGKSARDIVSERCQIPVIEPNSVAIALAAAQIGVGLSQSPICYPPRSHSIVERLIPELSK